jgi:hypothetical protein
VAFLFFEPCRLETATEIDLSPPNPRDITESQSSSSPARAGFRFVFERRSVQDINFSTFRVFQTAVNAAIPIGADIVTVDASGGPRTITLPSPSIFSSGPGQLGTIRILKTDGSANAVTIATPDGAIVGKTSLPSQNASATCVPSGAGQWFIF